ncbi:uncharacterized protein LOC110447971 [Mizuhopecten yessoensis]|uniref:uncharacterized protein LOC110447971 n=1 Tax=Mizuhopecten yessoensis TaxID=6573 RepID=UPI000B45855E|nr:uncharacterized protein LOC110447971 [Mizuhopecten yessoensis]
MPPQNRDDYERLKDVSNFFASGQLRQGWHHWQDYVHRRNLQVGYENPLPEPTLKIRFLASVLFIVWALQTITGIAISLTIDGIEEDLRLDGRFREFYAIRRVLDHIMAIVCIFKRF